MAIGKRTHRPAGGPPLPAALLSVFALGLLVGTGAPGEIAGERAREASAETVATRHILKLGDDVAVSWDREGRFDGPRLASLLRTLEMARIDIQPFYPCYLGQYLDPTGQAPPDTSKVLAHRLKVRLTRYALLGIPADADLAGLGRVIGREPAVEHFQPLPILGPASCVHTAGSWSDQQGYLRPSCSGGVDAEIAWTLPGGDGYLPDLEDGFDVMVADCTYSHTDLPEDICTAPAQPDDVNSHGTSVLGILAARWSESGPEEWIRGMVPRARFHFGAIRGGCLPDSGSMADVFAHADACLGQGDVFVCSLIEHTPTGEIPINGVLVYRDGLQALAERGVTAVIAAGNDGLDLGDVTRYDENGNPVHPWAEASSSWDATTIIVGGRESTGVCYHLSNYGPRVDCHSWAANVATLCLDGGGPGFTADFNATSAATPIVAGAAACLQGALRGAGRQPLSPREMRALLRDTPGLYVSDEAEHHIGPQPDLAELLRAVGLLPAICIRDGPGEGADHCRRPVAEFRCSDFILAENGLEGLVVITQPDGGADAPERLAPRSGRATAAFLRGRNLGNATASATVHVYRAPPSPLPAPGSWIRLGALPLVVASEETAVSPVGLWLSPADAAPSPFDDPAGEGGPWHSWVLLREQGGTAALRLSLERGESDLVDLLVCSPDLRFRNFERARFRCLGPSCVSEVLPLRIHRIDNRPEPLDLVLSHDLPSDARLIARSGDFSCRIDLRTRAVEIDLPGGWPPPLTGSFDVSGGSEIRLRSLTVNGGEHADLFLQVELPRDSVRRTHVLRTDIELAGDTPVRIGRFTYEIARE